MVESADERAFVLAMIETRKGAQNLESILAVDGVDGGHLGQLGLSLSLGIPA